MSWCWSTSTARRRTATTSSWAATAATGPTSGRYPGVNSFGRKGEEGNLLALHPTVKPVKLVADAILDCSARGEVVLDAFLGSGTTLMAAERVGRCCFGLELDPLYVDTIIRRWEALTGETARHAATGCRFAELAASRACRKGGVP